MVSASRDWLLRVWDLSSLTLVATLPGHRGAVRCLASSVHAPNALYSGANACTVRGWDIATLQGGGKKQAELEAFLQQSGTLKYGLSVDICMWLYMFHYDLSVGICTCLRFSASLPATGLAAYPAANWMPCPIARRAHAHA